MSRWIDYAATFRYNLYTNRKQAVDLTYNSWRWQSSQRMNELEKRLSKKQFFRCHNSYMVNFDYVEGVKKDSVLIKDKVQKLKTIPISKYKKEEFMRALARYVGKWEN